MDDVPAAADASELIVLRVVLCAVGKTPASGESPLPVPSPSASLSEQLGRNVAASESFGKTPTTRSGRSRAGSRSSHMDYHEARQRRCKHFECDENFTTPRNVCRRRILAPTGEGLTAHLSQLYR